MEEKEIKNSNSENNSTGKKEDKRNINQRIEDLVHQMEKANETIKKTFSLKFAFIRGVLQGLGIIIGSTILAGALYAITIQIFGNDVLDSIILDNVVESIKQDK